MKLPLKMGETGEVGGDTGISKADLSSLAPLLMLTTSWLNWMLFFSWTLFVTTVFLTAVCLMALFSGAAFAGGTAGGGGGGGDMDDSEDTGETGAWGARNLLVAFC